MRHFILIFTLALLVGCGHIPSYPEKLARRCSEFGFRPGTDAMASCMHRESLADDAWVERAGERNLERAIRCPLSSWGC